MAGDNMLVDVSRILKNPGAQEEFEFILEEALDADEIKITGPVLVKGAVLNVGNLLEMTVHVKTRFKAQCYRCLDPVESELAFSFTENYCPAEGAGDDADEEQSSLCVGVFEDDELDVSLAVKENLLLNLPMRVLCKADCPGICPHCGANLKTEICRCENEGVDPRLAILAQLKKKN